MHLHLGMDNWTKPGIGRGRGVTRTRSILSKLLVWLSGPGSLCTDWQRIATVTAEQGRGKCHLSMPRMKLRVVKLKSPAMDVQVRRWTLDFDDGSIQDLSIGCLLRGTESRSIVVAGRALKGMIVECKANECVRAARLEVWAQA